MVSASALGSLSQQCQPLPGGGRGEAGLRGWAVLQVGVGWTQLLSPVRGGQQWWLDWEGWLWELWGGDRPLKDPL